jgi:hypothetical protein
MKRIILVVLMVALVATPCLAQEVEPDGLFSIEGTLWRFGTEITFSTLPPFLHIYNSNSKLGFHQETVYNCSEDDCKLLPKLSYIDLPVLSIAYGFDPLGLGLIVMQPIGLGIETLFGSTFPVPGFYYSIAMMYKVEDDWSPYDQPIRCYSSYYICPEPMVCVDDYCQ